jgi:hypothetical protein
MARKKEGPRKKEAARRSDADEVYDLTTPLWSRYYEAVRKRVRFPRYFKRTASE